MNMLKEFRENIGKSKQEMADELQVSKSFYEKIEYGTKKPGRELIEKFKKKYPYFDINIFLN